MSFRAVFISVVLATALVIAAFMVNRQRPVEITEQTTAELIRASGKCAECHITQQYSVVHEYQLSAHARKNINCLMCHQPAAGQEKHEHNGFVIAKRLTAANCKTCHEKIYEQFTMSRHAAPAWGAVFGEKGAAAHGERDLTVEQVAFAERLHPGSVRRPANGLAMLEGQAAVASGCASCHGVGRPNADGTIGTCTACHTRHTSSVEVARMPRTCGQCHMGPDHSQIEIYEASKHGVMFEVQRHLLNMKRKVGSVTTEDMFVPTCATCHMGGLNDTPSTHNTSERLSYNLAAEFSEPRPKAADAQARMKEVCASCHTEQTYERVYSAATKVVTDTNAKVRAAKDIIDGLRKDGVLTGPAFSNPIEFAYFDLWHYYGRTSKHGAFMGGGDFVQWHGQYPMLKSTVEIKAAAEALRSAHAK